MYDNWAYLIRSFTFFQAFVNRYLTFEMNGCMWQFTMTERRTSFYFFERVTMMGSSKKPGTFNCGLVIIAKLCVRGFCNDF